MLDASDNELTRERCLSLQVALKGGALRSVSMVLLARALSEEPTALPVLVEGYGVDRTQRSSSIGKEFRRQLKNRRLRDRLGMPSPRVPESAKVSRTPGEATQGMASWRKVPQLLARRLASALSGQPQPLLSVIEDGDGRRALPAPSDTVCRPSLTTSQV